MRPTISWRVHLASGGEAIKNLDRPRPPLYIDITLILFLTSNLSFPGGRYAYFIRGGGVKTDESNYLDGIFYIMYYMGPIYIIFWMW